MEHTSDHIGGALQQAGEPTIITPELQKLDKDRITSDCDAPEEVFLYRLCGTPCFPRGDLTTVTGPAKSGKTFFISMLMACAVRHEVMGLERIREEPLKVLWYDTEQSRYTTKRILVDRVGKMIDTPIPDELFYVFNVRNRSTEERLEYLTQAIEVYRPDICIIDGIADLLDDINCGPASLDVMMRLLALALKCKCNITSVIHLNRSGEKLNLRGWIGTVMVQKSYEVFNCDRLGKTNAFTTELTFSRRFPRNEGLCFEIDNQGLPVGSDAKRQGNQGDRTVACGQGLPDRRSFNQEYVIDNAQDQYLPWDFRRLFTAAFGTVAMLGCDDLEKRVKDIAGIRHSSYYEKVFDEAERLRIVRKELTRSGRVGVILLPPS